MDSIRDLLVLHTNRFLLDFPGKLPTYIIPCVPAAALLISVGVLQRFRYRREAVQKWIYPSVLLFVFGLIVIEWATG